MSSHCRRTSALASSARLLDSPSSLRWCSAYASRTSAHACRSACGRWRGRCFQSLEAGESTLGASTCFPRWTEFGGRKWPPVWHALPHSTLAKPPAASQLTIRPVRSGRQNSRICEGLDALHKIRRD